MWDQTIGFQLTRESPFSVWGQNPGLDPLLSVVKVAVIALAIAVAFVPRRRDALQIAALGAAVLIATQFVAIHWFYLYIVWFAPFLLVALFGEYSQPDSGAERDVGGELSSWSAQAGDRCRDIPVASVSPRARVQASELLRRSLCSASLRSSAPSTRSTTRSAVRPTSSCSRSGLPCVT